jgi:hypothetical protein
MAKPATTIFYTVSSYPPILNLFPFTISIWHLPA